MTALAGCGYTVELASRLRSFDREGDDERQRRIERVGKRAADRLIARYRARPADERPCAWVTYHAYHKSPDWLGPTLQRALNIPYLLIEASFAPKQASGPWALGHRATEQAIKSADVTLALTEVDHAGLAPLITGPRSLRRLPPFLDPAPFERAWSMRDRHRRRIAAQFHLDPSIPWILAVGMMRDDVKYQSYALLARTLQQLRSRSWQVLLVGDGPSRPLVEDLFMPLGSERVRMAGILGEHELPACYAAADVYAWPAVREAYGLALLEAQASGLPVVAGLEGGVAEVVRDAVTGVLTPPRDPGALARAIADLLDHPAKRRKMAGAAKAFVERERSLAQATALLGRALTEARSIAGSSPRRQQVEH